MCPDCEKYKKALEKIYSLKDVKEIKGGFYDVGVPEHLVSGDGFVPIPVMFKNALVYVSKIAKEALD